MSVPKQRKSHAHLNIQARQRKAEKLIAILRQQRPLKGLDALEIGTGSGVISNCLAAAVGESGHVESVDVVDQRIITDGYHYTKVDDTKLPFDDSRFDIVVSNHVIEHVGDRAAQLQHLQEIARVLRPNGVGYLAAPSRWALVEPHFQMWFLSWLPSGLDHLYVRFAGKGSNYDCLPPGPWQARSLFRKAGLKCDNAAPNAMKTMIDIEQQGPLLRLAAQLPHWLLSGLSFTFPTMVFLLQVRPKR